MNVLVTGASSGIGKSLAAHLVCQGHAVWGLARRAEELSKMEQELAHEKGTFRWSTGDVRNQEDITHMRNIMRQVSFFPDVFYLAAGVFPNDTTPCFNFSLFRETMDTNVEGAMGVVDVFLDECLEQSRGHFIVLSSIAAFRPNRWSIGYSASKAAVALAFRGLQLVYRSQGILCTVAYLGPVDTPLWKWKKSFLVANKEVVARKLAGLLYSRKETYYVPFVSTFLFRISQCISDRWYAAIRRIIVR